jgi:hypothetical protein
MRLTEIRVTVGMLCLSYILCILPPSAQAKPPKLVPLKPIFDTSVLPAASRFQFKIQHTDFAYPQEQSALFHASAQVFTLHAQENARVLTGRVADSASPLNTAEHGIKSVFHHDLFAMVPKIAPDLSRQLEAQIERSGRKLRGQLEKETPEMQRQLAARLPVTAIPAIPAGASMPAIPQLQGGVQIPAAASQVPHLAPLATAIPSAPNLAAQVLAEQSRTKQVASDDLNRAKAQMQQALHPQKNGSGIPSSGSGDGGAPQLLANAGGRGAGEPPAMPTAAALAPKVTDLDRERIQPRVDMPLDKPSLHQDLPRDSDVNGKLHIPQGQIKAEMATAGRLQASSNDVNAQLRKATDLASQATPQMAAIMTRVRRLPSPTVPELLAVAQKLPMQTSGGDQTILWDAWHAKFAKLAQAPLISAFRKVGDPSGSDTVSITVSPDHRVAVKLTKQSNPKFDKAVMEAYRSLDRNPALAYPAGSLRSSVSFLVDNDHRAEGSVSTVKSQTTVGDKEVRHLSR